MSKSRILARQGGRGSERECGEEKVDYTIKEGRFQGGERRQAKKNSQEEVEGSISE